MNEIGAYDDCVEITPIKKVGEVGSDDYTRTIRVSLDEKYQVSVYLVNSEMATRSTTLHFDLAEEAFNFSYTSTFEPQSYFSAWLPNMDVVDTAEGKYTYVTLARHSQG